MPDKAPLQPATYYKITAEDINPDCVNFEKSFEVAQFYSNDGTNYTVVCGRCGQEMTITSATILDPQPIVT